MRKNIKSGLQPLIIVLGGGIQQTRCIKRCQQLGYMVCCFDMNDKCYGAPVADLFFQISIKKFDKIVSVVASLKTL